jgi:hypothetical protein
MPVLYDDIRIAIQTAIAAADPDCPTANIHLYRRNPVNPNKQVLFDLVGKQVQGKDRYHGYDMTRINSTETEVEAESGEYLALTYQELWIIRAWQSHIDEEASEVTFQRTISLVRDSLRGHTAIRTLMDDWNLDLGTVSIDRISLQTLDGEELVHYAELSIRFAHTGHSPN